MTSPLGDFLRPEGFAGPRGLCALARESSTVEITRLVRRGVAAQTRRVGTPYAARSPERTGRPVVLVPGFMAGDLSLRLLARHLRAEGFRTYRSQITANVRCTRAASDSLERRIEAIALKRGTRVTVVGHSLGGLLARGLATRRPDLIEEIVTLGSPMLAPGAVHQVLAWDLRVLLALSRAGVRGLMADDCVAGDCAALGWEEARTPVHEDIGFTTVYSRRDGIVDWRGCVDPQAQQIEVWASHLGMIIDPHVFDVVTDVLVDSASRVSRPSLRTVPHASAG